MINDANADRDAITGLRSPTNFGRPNWNAIFRSIRKIHAPGEGMNPLSPFIMGIPELTIMLAGAFFCGPKGLGSQLHLKCNENSGPGGSPLLNTKPHEASI